MAPEQACGELDRLDERADVFGLGAVLCEVLTGKPPYTGRDEYQIIRKALRADLADAHSFLANSGAEPELLALCRRCLAAEPDDRPRHAGEVADAVAALRAAAEDRARRAELDRVRVSEQGKRRRVLLAASGAVVAVLLAGLSVSLWQMIRAMDAERRAKSNEAAANEERDLKAKALKAETKARQQAFAALRSMTTDVVERKFAQGAVLTDDDKAFLRGVIAQFDAFAAIQGDDADSRAARAEGRFRVGRMRYRLGELKEAEADHDAALGIYKQLAADFPNQPDLRNELAGAYGSLANLHLQQGNWAAAKQLLLEGRPHHVAALRANPRHPTYRQFYHNHLRVLTSVHAGLLETNEAVQTAEARRDLGWDPPDDAHDAACFLSACISIAAKHQKLDDQQRKELAQIYDDAAMKLLRDAVNKGYKDVAQMKKDANLDPLRQRESFRSLVAELEKTPK
jgi:tetratricopeptide (TPR) repeat protein